MATDAKRPGEDAPRLGEASASPSTPLRPDDRSPAGTPDLEGLHRKARVALARALGPDEQPRLWIPGLASAAIIATESRAFVLKTGAKAGLPFGARLKEFEYESVMRVDLRPAGEVDVVVIHAPLMISTCASYWADSRDDPWRARNAIAVTRGSGLAASSVVELSRLLQTFRDRSAARRAERVVEPQAGDERAPDIAGRIAGLEQLGEREAPRTDCQRCGNELGEGWQYCPRCGAPAKLRSRRGVAQRRRRQPEPND